MALTRSYVQSTIGQGGANIFLYDLNCTGNESMLQDCPSRLQATCNHSDDVGVRCNYTGRNLNVFGCFILY